MTEKRFITIESGIDYGVIDSQTGEKIFDEDITKKLNELYKNNNELKEAMKRMMIDMMSIQNP